MYKPGSIRKIQVQDFVTHSYVEMFPGPNLNMIIGPNGTGKSTIVAAIILGLGGNPKTVGRGTRVSEYVKHNCDCAKINIYLQDEDQKSIIKVTREFDLREKSYWKLNDKKCSNADVLEKIKKFNIQVDNLCQFLPQDRVADFAKLNKKDLLRETQQALCRADLIEKQAALITAREKHKGLLELSTKRAAELQEAQDSNSRLEGRVMNFNKKIKYKERIAHIDRKIAWTEYEEKRAELGEIKRDKAKAQEVHDKQKKAIRPMEKDIDVIRQSMTQKQNKYKHGLQLYRDQEVSANATLEEIEAQRAKIRRVEDDMKTKLAESEQWHKQIEETVAKLDQMKQLHTDALAKNRQGEQQKQSVSQEINKCTNFIRKLQEQKYVIQQACSDAKDEIRAIESEQSRIEDIKQRRFEQLRRVNKDAYTAVLWLRNNQQMFKGKIYEPIMLELNVLDNAKAKYVESVIPLRDRLAFTCTNKQDMNLFIRTLREEQKLSVNVLYAGPETDKFKRPTIPIERLRKWGFYAYLNSLFTAPEPIMRYLCQTYKLHDIPIGDATTNDCYESVPREIMVFFSDKNRYVISFSKYSGEKSSRQNEVFSDGGLSISLDVVRLENIKGRLNDSRRKVEELQTQLEGISTKISSLEEANRHNRERFMELQKQKQYADSLKNKIEASQQNLEEMKSNQRNPEAIKKEADRLILKLIHSVGTLQDTLKEKFRKFAKLKEECDLLSLEVEQFRTKIEYLENQLVDSKTKIREAEEILKLISDKYNAAMLEAKAQLQKAKSLSKGFTPVDDGFDEFREIYESLGSSIEELNAEKENLNSRIGCLNTADDAEIEDYENRVSLIERLGQSIETISSDINKICVKMERMQKEWLGPLDDLVTGINLRFASAFERMGCAGEVGVCPGDNDKDYADYGLSIKVTYRSGEPLQELNATVQSGGERAVATAAFMLALQELTPVPFRCADEINQGMDSNNERRIFDLIVETTSKEDTSQYFLVTPKLVPKLNYTNKTMVHVVHNGPFINPDRKWSGSRFCNPHKVRID